MDDDRRELGQPSVGEIADAQEVWISGLSLKNGNIAGPYWGGNTGGDGGGILATGTQVSLSEVVIAGCYGRRGGGVYTTSPMSVSRSTIADNLTLIDSQSYGGGIYSTAALDVTDSTISGNDATEGAGIYNSGTLTVENSTIAGNIGSGVYNANAATAELVNVTLSANGSDYGYGGAIRNQGILSLVQSTVTNNHAYRGGGYL